MSTGSRCSLLVGFVSTRNGQRRNAKRRTVIRSIFLSPYKHKVSCTSGSSLMVWGVWISSGRFTVSGLFCFLLCLATHLSATAEFPSSAWGSVHLFFPTKLAEKREEKPAYVCFHYHPFSSPFNQTLNATHPYAMWMNKLHFFCVRKE